MSTHACEGTLASVLGDILMMRVRARVCAENGHTAHEERNMCTCAHALTPYAEVWATHVCALGHHG
jgi:hypothetical protein